MSAFGSPSKSSTAASSPIASPLPQGIASSSSPQHSSGLESPAPAKTRTERSASRPMSMVQAYQPPLMEIAQDTIPELQPIFTFLNSHSNKLYQEGYFLKLNDLDSRGLPNRHNDRFLELKVLQLDEPMLIDRGPSVSPSWWAQFCHYGMLLPLMPQVEMAR